MSSGPELIAAEIPHRNNPWIGEFSAEDGDLVYFLFVEQTVLCTVNSFVKALFLWFALYYVFNLEYEKNSKDLCLFFQELVFGLPDNLCKKSSTYLSISTDIQHFASQ
jgi:hypothetical protein